MANNLISPIHILLLKEKHSMSWKLDFVHTDESRLSLFSLPSKSEKVQREEESDITQHVYGTLFRHGQTL